MCLGKNLHILVFGDWRWIILCCICPLQTWSKIQEPEPLKLTSYKKNIILQEHIVNTWSFIASTINQCHPVRHWWTHCDHLISSLQKPSKLNLLLFVSWTHYEHFTEFPTSLRGMFQLFYIPTARRNHARPIETEVRACKSNTYNEVRLLHHITSMPKDQIELKPQVLVIKKRVYFCLLWMVFFSKEFLTDNKKLAVLHNHHQRYITWILFRFVEILGIHVMVRRYGDRQKQERYVGGDVKQIRWWVYFPTMGDSRVGEASWGPKRGMGQLGWGRGKIENFC